MPTRTLVAVPAVVWLFAVIGMTSRSYALALIAFLSTALALMQIIYTSNLLQAAHQFARIHDQALAAQISDRIVEAHPDFDPRKTYAVDFFGAHPFVTSYPRPPSSTSGFSFFEWDGGNEERILDYMGLIGYANLRTPSFDQRRRDLSEFQQMSEWPSRDSVRIVGDVTLVKLGPARGFLPFTVP